MKILVQRQDGIETRELPDEPFVVVSISTPGYRRANIPENPLCRGILFTEFSDVQRRFELSRPGASEKRFIDPISDAQAEEIWAFIQEHKDIAVLVCQCEAGISRSAGLAAAVSKILTGSDDYFFSRYCPNSTVYSAIMRAAGFGNVTAPPLIRTESNSRRDTMFTESPGEDGDEL